MLQNYEKSREEQKNTFVFSSGLDDSLALCIFSSKILAIHHKGRGHPATRDAL